MSEFAKAKTATSESSKNLENISSEQSVDL